MRHKAGTRGHRKMGMGRLEGWKLGRGFGAAGLRGENWGPGGENRGPGGDLRGFCSSSTQVTSAEEVEAALELVKKTFGKLELAVNCAGVGIAVKTYNAKKDKVHELEDFQRVVNVSV